jgi:hypothetical protein
MQRKPFGHAKVLLGTRNNAHQSSHENLQQSHGHAKYPTEHQHHDSEQTGLLFLKCQQRKEKYPDGALLPPVQVATKKQRW